MRSRSVVLVLVSLLASWLLLGGGSRSVHSAALQKRVCKTTKKHGRKVKHCHTVQPAPTATPLPTATPTTMYAANWSAGMDGWTAAGNGTWTVSNGALSYDGTGESTIVSPYANTQPNYFVEATIQLTGSPNSNSLFDGFGVLFRAAGPLDPAGSPEAPGLGAGLIRPNFGGTPDFSYLSIITPVDNGDIYKGHADFTPDQAPHVYRLEVRQNDFQVYLDGHLAVTQPNVNAYFSYTRVGLYSLGDPIVVKSFRVGPL
jgi:hypothetical protein